jgi:hypothetical protein
MKKQKRLSEKETRTMIQKMGIVRFCFVWARFGEVAP